MKIALGNIITAMPILNKLGGQSLPVKESYKLAKLIRNVNIEAEIYDRERIKLCERYGKIYQEENRYEISDKEKFDKAYSELISQEVELNFEPFVVPDTVRLTAAEIMAVEDFIKFEED